MNKLDTLVRQCLLAYPTLFQTRWHALEHIYVGNGTGYEWESTPDGSVVMSVCGGRPFSEKRARRAFFRDCDENEARNEKDRERYGDALSELVDLCTKNATLERRRREFMLEHLDLIVFEDSRYRVHAENVIARIYHPRCLNVPDDAEPSFRKGALEVLDALIPALYHAERGGKDHDWRAKFVAERNRLTPPPSPAFLAAIQEIVKSL